MFLLILLVILTSFYYIGTKNYNYWKDRNVKHNKPLPFFGNNLRHYQQKASYVELANELYTQYPNEKFVGFYRGITPELLIRDPNIIKHVLSADFQSFYTRGLGRDTDVEPMLKNLFHSEGDLWKLLRQRLSPTFTSGKLKSMFPLIVECAEELQRTAAAIAEKGVQYDIRELTARFTTDFIGACGFGIKMNSMNDDQSQFREMGKRIFQIKFSEAWRTFLKETSPKLFHNLKPFSQHLEDSIISLLTSVIQQRGNKPIGRNDFIDILLSLKAQGKVAVDSIQIKDVNEGNSKLEIEFDLRLMAAQCFIFFAAGFETSSSATSYTLHELAYHQEIQRELQEEIDSVLAKYGGKLSYESIKEMTLLECALKEGLRKFPSVGVLNRVCTKKYKIPGTDIVIDEGVKVLVPVAAIQNDETYFENANEFNPRRFLPEFENKMTKYTYLPFGEGPRQCIGSRLGIMQSMAGLAAILQKFTVIPGPDSTRDLVLIHKSRIIQMVQDGLPLILKKRENCC